MDEFIIHVLTPSLRDYYAQAAADPDNSAMTFTTIGAEIFAKQVLERMFAAGVVARAKEHARDCDFRPIAGKTGLQRLITDVLIEYFEGSFTPHPRLKDRARAAAEVLAAEVGAGPERQALFMANRLQEMTEFEQIAEREAEREDRIERMIHRPRRKKLYDV
jgi:hypothetical protein